MAEQSTNIVMMVRPHQFGFNAETAANNAFQVDDNSKSPDEIQANALKEFDEMVLLLRDNDITVEVFEDTPEPVKPDVLFPNNWISMHAAGALITYPMMSEIRRAERREDIISVLIDKYGFGRRYSLEQYEEKGIFLESTGSMVIDHRDRVVYACLSIRTDPSILDKFCTLMSYKRVVFSAVDKNGQAIYHTNVMMSIGEELAIVCLDSLPHAHERTEVESALKQAGRTILPISMEQMESFAGNMLELRRIGKRNILVMSEQAFRSLTPDQVQQIRQFVDPIYTPLYTIEKYGGGSARCMLAEIFRPQN